MLPKQINPTDPNDTAMAPYNFVPLPDQLVAYEPDTLPDQDSYHLQRHSGRIECRLTTETPTFVRAPLPLEQYQMLESADDAGQPYDKRLKNRAEFFYTTFPDSPRIPGSTLRGMIRTLIEIIGHGKFDGVTDNKLVYRSVGDTTSHGEKYRDRILTLDEIGYDEEDKRFRAYSPNVRAGYLLFQDGEWRIQPAQTISGSSFARIHMKLLERLDGKPEKVGDCRNAHYLYIQPGINEHQNIRGGHIRIRYPKVLRSSCRDGSGLIKGVVARSGAIFSKRHEAVVYPLDPTATAIEISDEILRDYRNQVSQEQQALLGKEGALTEPNSAMRKEKEADGFAKHRQPVFYLLDEKEELLFFGHTMMMRLPYENSPKDLVPDYLRNETRLDLAESIFGHVNDNGEGKASAYASRIFVSDAVLLPDQQSIFASQEPITPKILASPKPTAFQQYLVQEQPDKIEVGRTRDQKPIYQKFLADYNANRPTTVRGFKLYWHKSDDVTLADIKESDLRFNEMEERARDGKERRRKRDSQYTQMKPVRSGVSFTFSIRFENLSDIELGGLLWALRLPDSNNQQHRHKIGMGKAYGMGTVHLEPTLYLEDRTQRYQSLFDMIQETLTWNEGTKDLSADEQPAVLIAQFEREVLARLGQEQSISLADLPRIQVLLRMLAWPGIPKEQSRYLEIERTHPTLPRGKINEYKERPVLPIPLETSRPSRVVPTNSEPVRVQPKRTEAENKAAADFAARMMEWLGGEAPAKQEANPVEQVSMPTSKANIFTGMMLEGKVVRVEPSRVVVNIGIEEATLVKEELVPPGRDLHEMRDRFLDNATITVWVKGINSKGRVQLTQRRPKP